MLKTSGTLRALALAVSLTALGAGCQATVGTSMVSVPPNSGQICGNYCQAIGMQLSAVAIMANNVGCVCQPVPAPAAGGGRVGELSTPAAGMATIAAQQAAAVVAQQSTQRRASGK